VNLVIQMGILMFVILLFVIMKWNNLRTTTCFCIITYAQKTHIWEAFLF
jgi:hypothetical protein